MIIREETNWALRRSIPITKQMVWAANKQVKRNGGSAGVDQQSLRDFNMNHSQELYKIGNRLASGSYFPPPVRRVEISKGNGKLRPLGIPTVGDRIAHQVIKQYLAPRLEQEFLLVLMDIVPTEVLIWH